MGAIHKMVATLGIPQLRGPCEATSPVSVVCRISPSTSFLVFSSSCGQKSLIPTKIFPARHPLLVTMLIFALTGLRYRIKFWENSKDLRLSATCDGRAESDAGISERPNWFRCTGWHYDRKEPSVSSTSSKTSFSSRLMEERWRAEHRLQSPTSMALTVVHYTCTVGSLPDLAD